MLSFIASIMIYAAPIAYQMPKIYPEVETASVDMDLQCCEFGLEFIEDYCGVEVDEFKVCEFGR